MQRKTRSANIGTRLLYGQQLLVLHVSKLYMHVVSSKCSECVLDRIRFPIPR